MERAEDSNLLDPQGETAGRVRDAEARALAAEAEVARLAEELLLLGRALAESSNGTVIVDMRQEDCPIVFCSEAFVRLTGYSREEVIGRNCRFLQGHEREQESLTELRAALREGRETMVTLRNYRKDGSAFWNELRMAPVRDSEGEVTHFVGIQNDVSALKLSQDQLVRLNRVLEDRVDRRTEELLELNRQMQSFTYSISHDLRAPLRGIIAASMILLEDFGARVSDDMRALLDQQAASAQQLGGLIEDLLKLSRLGRAEMDKSAVDLSAIAQRVADDVATRPGRQGFQAHVQEGLQAAADPTLMAIVLDNLLDNAGKFVRSGEAARVEVGRAVESGESVFFVRDHGIGLEQEFAERIFQPFERLHSESQFPGTGIGLANVRLVVQRHGGRVWAKGEPGMGTTIHFTLGSDQLRLDGQSAGA